MNNKGADQTARMLFTYVINRFSHDVAHLNVFPEAFTFICWKHGPLMFHATKQWLNKCLKPLILSILFAYKHFGLSCPFSKLGSSWVKQQIIALSELCFAKIFPFMNKLAQVQAQCLSGPHDLKAFQV